MKNIAKYAMILAATVALTSCNDWLTEDTPGVTKRGDYITSAETATEVVNAAYVPLMWEYGNSTTYYSEWFIGDIVSDDALKGGQNLSDMADAYDMENFKTNTNNKLLLGFFRAQWQGVQRANLAIESVNGLALDDSFTQELKDRLIAEATFLRAMYYFRLVRVYGGMPLIDYVVESSAQWNQERATRDATLQFIIRDLEACVEVLPLKSKYPIDDMGRATRGAAQAMLLKANLYRAGFLAQEGGDATAAYREAKKWGEEIMSTNEYDLVPNYFDQYDTTVHFITEEEFDREHNKMPHGGFVMRSGLTGDGEKTHQMIEYSLKLESNPEFTASVLICYARAMSRLFSEGQRGCRTAFDIAPAYLSPLSPEELRAQML